MGTIHRFRRLRWGLSRKLSTPRFLREPASFTVQRVAGFGALAALALAAAMVLIAT